MTGSPMPEQTCSHCHTPIGTRPFCPRDGVISGDGRFVIGTRYVAEELLGLGNVEVDRGIGSAEHLADRFDG